MELYHGTALRFVERILREGLWSRRSLGIRPTVEGHEHLVFAAHSKIHAHRYARLADWGAPTVAIVCIHDPVTAGFKLLQPEGQDWVSPIAEWAAEGRVEREFIHRIEVFSGDLQRILTEPLEVISQGSGEKILRTSCLKQIGV